MGKIVAIGGGELRLGETSLLDKLIVRMCGTAAPRLLFVPTASGDSPQYIEEIKSVYGGLGCKVDTLCLCSGAETDTDIRRKLEWADAFYVGGGDTAAMMDCWRGRHVDEGFREAYRRGAVMAGLSAGAICWFEFGNGGDPEDLWGFARVRGLGLIPAACCPHYNAEGDNFDRMMEGLTLPGIALGNLAAFVEENGIFRIAKADPSADAFLLYTLRGELIKQPLEDSEIFKL